jgi:hypothetical protein
MQVNSDVKVTGKSFENVSQFRYLGMTVRNKNLIQEEIKGRLNSGKKDEVMGTCRKLHNEKLYDLYS